MHLSYKGNSELMVFIPDSVSKRIFKDEADIDSQIFYSVPTSFFVIDERIPAVIRELITEAEGCVKMNYLTGASACARKAIYELTVREKATGQDYEEQIKSLKDKYSSIDATLFDDLVHIQDMTSDKIHEQSWPKWDSHHLSLILETLKAILYEIYVLPKEKEARSQEILRLREKVILNKKSGKKDPPKDETQQSQGRSD